MSDDYTTHDEENQPATGVCYTQRRTSRRQLPAARRPPPRLELELETGAGCGLDTAATGWTNGGRVAHRLLPVRLP